MSIVYHAFKGGHFSVQMSKDNPFGSNEADKTIENTIDRDCKTTGGYVGFSANFTFLKEAKKENALASEGKLCRPEKINRAIYTRKNKTRLT